MLGFRNDVWSMVAEWELPCSVNKGGDVEYRVCKTENGYVKQELLTVHSGLCTVC